MAVDLHSTQLPCLILITCLILEGAAAAGATSTSHPRPKPFKLSLPPFSSKSMICEYNKTASQNIAPEFICVPSRPTPGKYVYLSDDIEPISVRYQYKKKVQLWKKGCPYAASFSTQFTFEISKASESSHEGVFGAGLAFAITPKIDVGNSGPGSLGLFSIDPSTGLPAAAAANPRTVAVEIDLEQDSAAWDSGPKPHLGLDINSLRSVAKAAIDWELVDRKIAVFIDYDARRESLSVRLQNLTVNSGGRVNHPDKRKAKLFLSYSGLNLARYVNEASYIGFSSRVPVTEDGVYYLYDWTFATNWVLKRDK